MHYHLFEQVLAKYLRLLHNAGFTSVFECHVPFEPLKYEHRLTLVAMKGTREQISTYPWINQLNEAQIAERMRQFGRWKNPWAGSGNAAESTSGGGTAQWLKRILQKGLHKLGFEIHRI